MVFSKKALKSIMAALPAVLFSTSPARGELTLNFTAIPNGDPRIVASIANDSCNAGGQGFNNIGDCDNGYFLQQIITDGGNQYYHVILGNAGGTFANGFALQYYMRIGSLVAADNWSNGGFGIGAGGGFGMGAGGPAPYSSSFGVANTTDRLFNFYNPLSNDPRGGSGTGNPNRVAMRMINNDGNMAQEFLKSFEANKPKIIQTVTSGTAMTSNFALDMSNGGYNAYTTPSSFTNATTIAGVGTYNATATGSAPTATSNAGRFLYTPTTNPFGGSNGTYTYATGGFDNFRTDWLSYCIPSQNQAPVPNPNFDVFYGCNYAPRATGQMAGMGGMGGQQGGGMMGM